MYAPGGQLIRHGAAAKLALLAVAILALAGVIVLLNSGGQDPPPAKTDAERADGGTAAPPTDSTPPAANDATARPLQPVAIPLDADQQLVLDYITQGRFMDARAHLAVYQKKVRHCPVCEFLHGLSFHKEKRYEVARPFFERALELEPGYGPSWYFYGWCLYYLGELEKSKEAFTQHLALNPLEGDSHFGLGLIATDEGELEEAEQQFVEAIELQENNPRRIREVAKSYARLGDVYSMQDKLEEARTQLYLATELWPDHYEAFFKLSRVLYRLGEDAAAEEAMKKFEAAQARVEGMKPQPEASPEQSAPTEEGGIGP